MSHSEKPSHPVLEYAPAEPSRPWHGPFFIVVLSLLWGGSGLGLVYAAVELVRVAVNRGTAFQVIVFCAVAAVVGGIGVGMSWTAFIFAVQGLKQRAKGRQS